MTKREKITLKSKDVDEIHIDSAVTGIFHIILKLKDGQRRYFPEKMSLAYAMPYAIMLGQCLGVPKEKVQVSVEAIKKNKFADSYAGKASTYIQSLTENLTKPVIQNGIRKDA